jgi:uncharacterized membrane protein
MSNNSGDPEHVMGVAAAGLPDAPARADAALREAGIDPDRLGISYFGAPDAVSQAVRPAWARRLLLGFGLWAATYMAEKLGFELSNWLQASISLGVGLLIIQIACDALIIACERLAARLQWDHYVAGTAAEILATLPELVVIGFLIPVSPVAAFVVALVTIYNNALVFSIYSLFLPKDHHGKYLMPEPLTDAGTRILVAGAAMGLILGLVMLSLTFSDHPKKSFAPADLIFVGILLLAIFGVYIYKLLREFSMEEAEVRDTLELTREQIEKRRKLVYTPVHESSWPLIGWYLLIGIIGAALGGELLAAFADAAIRGLDFSHTATAVVLTGFAGMSEYVILWRSHRKGEHGLALANAFGGITQVMFLVLPFTLIAIGCYQVWINPQHPELPLPFSLPNMLLLLFLFPMLYVLVGLLEDDHTLGILDTTIMVSIFAVLLALLLTYGSYG